MTKEETKQRIAVMQAYVFGIMSSKDRKNYMSFKSLIDEGCDFCGYEGESFESAFDDIQFADDSPFGVKVEQ